MGRVLLIDGLSVTALLGLWYFCFARYNRRKGGAALQWIQVACAGRGRVLESHWAGSSRLQAKLHFASRWFENACLTVRLLPRPLPVQWLISRWRKQRETLTFEADLDCPPGFQLEVLNHRWSGRSPGKLPLDARHWMISRPGPVVLTTRLKSAQELTPVVQALITSREHKFLSVRFRPGSPHLSATVALDALSNQQAAAEFLSVLRELAAGASTKSL